MKEYNPNFVHIVTCGRTGSTLLAAVLNSIDGYSIKGENLLALDGLAQFTERISSLHNAVHSIDPTNPWFNDFDLDSMQQNVYKLITQFLDRTQTARVIGYKEIRYPLIQKQHLFKHLDFLKQVTNNCKMIFLTRKIDNLLKSGWWAWDVEKSKITITQFEQYMAEYMYIQHPDPNYCFQISYEDILEKNNKFESMFEFIGEKYEKEKIQKVLDKRYSYRTGEEYGEETKFDCTLARLTLHDIEKIQ